MNFSIRFWGVRGGAWAGAKPCAWTRGLSVAQRFAERDARRYGRPEPRFDPRTLAASAPTAEAEQLVLPLGLKLDEVTRRYVEAVLARSGGNKTEAARRLGVERDTVARAMNQKRRR